MPDLIDEIRNLKKSRNATILAHYYQEGDIQDLADFTGDSLKLARAATQVKTETIVFCGVHFMAETAKMLNPEKRVLLPDLQAGCSLADSCPADKLARFQEMLRENGSRDENRCWPNRVSYFLRIFRRRLAVILYPDLPLPSSSEIAATPLSQS